MLDKEKAADAFLDELGEYVETYWDVPGRVWLDEALVKGIDDPTEEDRYDIALWVIEKMATLIRDSYDTENEAKESEE